MLFSHPAEEAGVSEMTSWLRYVSTGQKKWRDYLIFNRFNHFYFWSSSEQHKSAGATSCTNLFVCTDDNRDLCEQRAHALSARCCCNFIEPPIPLCILSRLIRVKYGNAPEVCFISMRGAGKCVDDVYKYIYMCVYLKKTVNAQLTRGIKAASGPPGGEQYSGVSNGVFLGPWVKSFGGTFRGEDLASTENLGEKKKSESLNAQDGDFYVVCHLRTMRLVPKERWRPLLYNILKGSLGSILRHAVSATSADGKRCDRAAVVSVGSLGTSSPVFSLIFRIPCFHQIILGSGLDYDKVRKENQIQDCVSTHISSR